MRARRRAGRTGGPRRACAGTRGCERAVAVARLDELGLGLAPEPRRARPRRTSACASSVATSSTKGSRVRRITSKCTVLALGGRVGARTRRRASRCVSSMLLRASPSAPRRSMRAVMRARPSRPSGSCAAPDRNATSDADDRQARGSARRRSASRRHLLAALVIAFVAVFVVFVAVDHARRGRPRSRCAPSARGSAARRGARSPTA